MPKSCRKILSWDPRRASPIITAKERSYSARKWAKTFEGEIRKSVIDREDTVGKMRQMPWSEGKRRLIGGNIIIGKISFRE